MTRLARRKGIDEEQDHIPNRRLIWAPGGSSGRQTGRTRCGLLLYSLVGLLSSPSDHSKVMPKADKDRQRTRAKAGPLFSPSRPGSRSQTPATPDLDLESVQCTSLTSDTKLNENQCYQQPPPTVGVGSALITQSTQFNESPVPTAVDPDAIPQTHGCSSSQLLGTAPLAPTQGLPEAARLPSSASLSQTPVHIACI